jgi:iron complex transport system permease protein
VTLSQRAVLTAAASFVVLVAAALLALSLGAEVIPPAKVLAALTHRLPSGNEAATIVWQLRLPRIALALFVGAALALAGTVMQAYFRNPLADPYILGISSGAALGAVIALSLDLAGGASFGAVQAFAFVGAIAVMAAVFGITRATGRRDTLTLLLVGIALGVLLNSAVSYVMSRSTGGLLANQFFWLMGSLASARWQSVVILCAVTIVGGAAALVLSRELDILLLGDEEAQYLGVQVGRVRAVAIVAASLLTSVAVAAAGVVAFIGLIVPHIVRLVIGPSHRALLPIAAVAGAAFLILSDLVARTALAPAEIPIGIVTSLIGAPVFLVVLLRGRRA